MSVSFEFLEYYAIDTICESVIIDKDRDQKKPGLLLFPNFLGIKEWDINKAEEFADLGFKVLVVDLYGKNQREIDKSTGLKLLQEITADRRKLLAKIDVHYTKLANSTGISSGRMAAVGYCLGGKCVLDLARSGADIAGIIYHGLYDAPPFPNSQIIAKLLICHGWNDPLCPPVAMCELAQELSVAQADWQLNVYGNTGHAFTSQAVPSNVSRTHGYSAAAANRSWTATVNFLTDSFAFADLKQSV